LREKQKSASTVGGASSVNEPGSRQYTEDHNRRKPRRSNCFKTDSRPAADDRGEDDFSYFSARPDVRTRIRAAFRGEFPRKILKRGRGQPAVVIVAIERDHAGNPTTRARSITFLDGGST
jgi:hypothetical protein